MWSGKRYKLPEMEGGALEGGQPCVMRGHLFIGLGSQGRVGHLDVFE